MPIVNNRVFWACESVGIAPSAAPTTFKTVRGVQSVGLSARLPIQFLHELGNLRTYTSYEDSPEIEISLERLLDGYAPAFLSATQNASAATLVGRSNKFCSFAMSIHRDNQSTAVGNQIAQCTSTEAWASSVQYQFEINGPFKESISLVTDNAVWTATGYTFTGHTSGMGVASLVPAASEGADRRQHLIMADCRFPKNIPGITTTGLTVNQNEEVTVDGNTQFSVSFQSIQVSANLNRTAKMELGRKKVYCRYVEFPVDVTTTFNFISKTGALFSILSTTDNSTEEPIFLKATEGLIIDCGTANRLTSYNQTGGNAGAKGSDQMLEFVYVNSSSDMTIQHPADPTVALQP